MPYRSLCLSHIDLAPVELALMDIQSLSVTVGKAYWNFTEFHRSSVDRPS